VHALLLYKNISLFCFVTVDHRQLTHGCLPPFFKYGFIAGIWDGQMIRLCTGRLTGSTAYASGRVNQNPYKFLWDERHLPEVLGAKILRGRPRFLT
jgi:hypothetical protein